LVIVNWTHSNKPLKLLDTLLAENCKVIGSLLTCGYYKDLFVFVIPQGPQHKGSSNPAFAESTKCLDL
jgi:hypothetical protein